MKLLLDHIAILTDSLERVTSQLGEGFVLQGIDEQPTEGTREQYVTLPLTGAPALLLLEAILPGPYQRAKEKRGPGLHHLGCWTDNLDDAIAHAARQGLLLHPISLKTYERQAVWMCRPGVPFLLELWQSTDMPAGPVNDLTLEVPAGDAVGRAAITSLIPGVTIQPIEGTEIRFRMGTLVFAVTP